MVGELQVLPASKGRRCGFHQRACTQSRRVQPAMHRKLQDANGELGSNFRRSPMRRKWPAGFLKDGFQNCQRLRIELPIFNGHCVLPQGAPYQAVSSCQIDQPVTWRDTLVSLHGRPHKPSTPG